jgi:Gluconate 2-dehydrogenase subunit 3
VTASASDASHGFERFPGFDVVAQAGHWDAVTRELIDERLATGGPLRFFSRIEAQTAGALFDQLLDQRQEPRVPVLELVDARLARDETDGWRYETMPKDPDSWHWSLAALDADAVAEHELPFVALDWEQQAHLVDAIQGMKDERWHGMPATQLWSLWTRYACTAFYSHPAAWQQMGFAGPAYPRGYKNIGVDRRESFEVIDHHPEVDPQANS